MRWTLRELVSSLLLGLGAVTLSAPAALYVLIHGSDRRYLWLISGPPPFDRLGSGPVQLWLGVGLVATGVLLVLLASLVKVPDRRR
ncbi:MAG TPA: hypothetical protein VFR99_03240 [Marmoricola sp.]|nr:hypothetical protein [Marmoricola sp.]